MSDPSLIYQLSKPSLSCLAHYIKIGFTDPFGILAGSGYIPKFEVLKNVQVQNWKK